MQRFLVVVSLAALVACGGSVTGDGDADALAPECSGNSDCPGGYCSDGVCKYFAGADTTLPDRDLEDAVPGADTGGVDTTPGTDTPPAPDGPPRIPAADILVDPLDHMFTYVPGVTNPATTTVLIYNQGTGSLVIDSIAWAGDASPEFTFMALPPMPATIYPYEHTAVSVIFQEKAPHGPADLVISSNDPDSPEVVVHFTSQPKTGDLPCIQLQPSTLSFGQVVRGDTKTMPFSIINCSATTVLQITDIERSTFFGMPLTDEFQMVPQFLGQTMLGANQVLDWELSYSPGLAGPDSGYFIFHNNDPAQGQAKLNVAGVGVPPPMEEIGLHIELEWDTDSSDVDLHLLQPGGDFFDCDTDCYFSNPAPDWGTQGDVMDDPFLDYDDVDGYGPENINVSEPQPGSYKVLLHYYSDSYDGFGGGSSNAIVRVYSYGQLLQEFGPQNLDQTNRNWDVCLVDWPSATITPLGDLYMVSGSDMDICFPFF